MVNWESATDRGLRSPIRPRARGGGRQSKLRADKEKTPQPIPETKPAAPRGSTIANKLGRHAPHAWTSIPAPIHAIQVRTPTPPSATTLSNLPASVHTSCPMLPTRPHHGATISHRRRLAPRAGSPSHWAPRLVVLASGPHPSKGKPAFSRSDPTQPQHPPGAGLYSPLLSRTGYGSPPKQNFSSPPYIQEGAKTLGVAHLRCFEGKFYSGSPVVHPAVPIRAIHCNGRHPSFQTARKNSST